MFPVLTPLAIDPAHPFPFIPNLGFCLALKLRRIADDKHLYALVPVPSQVQRFWELPIDQGARKKRQRKIVALESFIILFLDHLFPGYEVEGRGLFRLIRDSDLEIEEEAEDLVREFEARLKKRRLGRVVRVKIQTTMPRGPARVHHRGPARRARGRGPGRRQAGPGPDVRADPARPSGPEVQALQRPLPRARARPRRRLLRGDPREGHPGPPPVRELRRGGAVPAPGGARSQRAGDQADPVPHLQGQPDRGGPDRGGRQRQERHGPGRDQGALRRGE
jgi:hypothetical protein